MKTIAVLLSILFWTPGLGAQTIQELTEKEGEVSYRLPPMLLRSEQMFLGQAITAQAEQGAGSGPLPGSLGSPWSVRGAMGFTLDPDAFLLAAELDYSLSDTLSVGPLLQYAVSDDLVILAPTANFQYTFNLTGMSPELQRLKPFVQGGVGFAYLHEDRKGRDDDDLGFLFNLGFGVEYYFTEKFALGNNLLFNILPGKTLGERFFFSWQFVTVRYRF